MIKDHGLVRINHHMYLFQDFTYPKLSLIDPFDGKIKFMDYDKMIKEIYKTGFFWIN